MHPHKSRPSYAAQVSAIAVMRTDSAAAGRTAAWLDLLQPSLTRYVTRSGLQRICPWPRIYFLYLDHYTIKYPAAVRFRSFLFRCCLAEWKSGRILKAPAWTNKQWCYALKTVTPSAELSG
jgi:hypothetical protein